jgi:hypothetical protein
MKKQEQPSIYNAYRDIEIIEKRVEESDFDHQRQKALEDIAGDIADVVIKMREFFSRFSTKH